ncbi:ATP-binding protein [Prosthecobacter fusiformis]|uniref:ATP-binding protein n=1 Tax=Prosthecobacter fusiformis TaxID=48464 RepID=UPI001FBC1132|nr:ATP-binding protein [Prosthecobacter fusiformis]
MENKLQTLPPAPLPQATQRLGWHSHYSSTQDTVEWIELNLGRTERLDAVVLIAPPPGAGVKEAGYGFPLRFRVELLGEGDDSQRIILADYTANDFANPGLLPVFIPAEGRMAHKVRITATRLFHEDRRYLFALGEVMLLQGGRNLGAEVEVLGPPYAHASSSQGTRPDWGRINIVDGHSALGPPLGEKPSPTFGFRSKPTSEVLSVQNPWVTIDLGAVRPVEEVRLFPAHPPQFAHSHGYGFPVKYQIELSLSADDSPVIFSAPQSGSYTAVPGDNVVTVITDQTSARFVRLKVLEPHVSNGSVVLAMAEMQVWSGGQNIAMGKPVLASAHTEVDGWSNAALVDGFTSSREIVDWTDWLTGLSRRRETEQGLARLDERQVAIMADLKNLGWWGLGAFFLMLILALLTAYFRQRLARRKEMEELRQRISQDLHDEIGSSLGSIMLISDEALSMASEGELGQDLQEIRETARQTMDSMRDIVRLAQTGSYGGDDLPAHMREIADRMLRGISHRLTADEISGLPMDRRRDLVLMFKETLHNLVRHAKASKAEIQLKQSRGTLMLTIRDDGCGFSPAKVQGQGMGLTNLQRRADKHGGSVEITSASGHGTTICITLPHHG